MDELTFEEAKKEALAVSHLEDVSAWIESILKHKSQFPQRLVELQQMLQMPLIEVWIALLLSGCELEQRGGFYETDSVWIH